MPKASYKQLNSLIDHGKSLDDIFEYARQKYLAMGNEDPGEIDQPQKRKESKAEKKQRLKYEQVKKHME